MARSYRPVDREQRFLLPPDMAEWLPADHLVWFLLEAVDRLDTSVLHAAHPLAGPGRRAYDPDMLLALLFYGYACGERSSRAIERRCEVDVAFRIVCGNDTPDHSTISRFHQRHQAAFTDLFAQVLTVCARAGMGRFGTVALDGTKIAANASMGANRTEEWLHAEAARISAEAAAVDAAEDEMFGPEMRGDELPPELADRTGRRERIDRALAQVAADRRAAEEASSEQKQRAEDYLAAVLAGESPRRPPNGVDKLAVARARVARDERQHAEAKGRRRSQLATQLRRNRQRLAALEAREAAAQAEAEVRAIGGNRGTDKGPDKPARNKALKANTTDPDSRLMKTRQGWVQGYNAQGVCSDDHLILDIRATQDANDKTWFEPMMKAAVFAALQMTAATDIDRAGATQDVEDDTAVEDVAIGEGLQSASLVDRSGTTPGAAAETSPWPPAEVDTHGWPIDAVLADAGYHSRHNLTVPGPDRLIAAGTARDLAYAARNHPAEGSPPSKAEPTEAMQHRLRTPEGHRAYRRRAATIEPVFGHLKDKTRLRRFRRRGLTAADAELKLAATVLNLTKLHTHLRPAT